MQVGYEKKIAIFDQYLASSRVVNGATVKCCTQTAAIYRSKLLTLIASSKRRRMFIAGDGRRSATRR